MPLAETSTAQADLLIVLLKLLQQMRELSLYNDMSLNCHPLLSSILMQCTTSEEIKTQIQTELDQLADCEGKTLLCQKLANLEINSNA